MRRDQFRLLTSQSGTPTLENVWRPTQRKTFKQLTLGKTEIIPIPYIGYVYRTVYAQSIADYNSLSTATWSSGTTGTTNNYNCLYFHQTVANQQTSNQEWILNPIRWTVDVPTTSASTYDHWIDPGDFTGDASDNRVQWGPTFLGSVLGYNQAIAFTNEIISANSHCVFGDSILKLAKWPFPVRCAPLRSNANNWVETTLNAISANPEMTYASTMLSISAAYFQFRVNGSAVGSLLENLTETSTPQVTPFAIGDTLEFDVWYKIKKRPYQFAVPSAGKLCYYIQTTRVSNGSRRMWPYPNSSSPIAGSINPYGTDPSIHITNVNMTPNFNYQSQTYNVTIAGHVGWTLKDGSDGPHKMATTTGWTRNATNSYLQWTPSDTSGYCAGLRLSYDREIPVIMFIAGTAMKATIPGIEYIYYRPSNSGDYATSSVSTEYGTINHAPSGVFNQAGTTTFSLVTWSVVPPFDAGTLTKWQPTDGRRSGGLLPTYLEVPTSITMTRTTL